MCWFLSRVFSVIVFAAMNIGQSSSFAPDFAKAKAAAGRILLLLEKKPAIDIYDESGDRPVSVTFGVWSMKLSEEIQLNKNEIIFFVLFSDKFFRACWIPRCPILLSNPSECESPTGPECISVSGTDSGPGGQQWLWEEHHYSASRTFLRPCGRPSGEFTGWVLCAWRSNPLFLSDQFMPDFVFACCTVCRR